MDHAMLSLKKAQWLGRYSETGIKLRKPVLPLGETGFLDAGGKLQKADVFPN